MYSFQLFKSMSRFDNCCSLSLTNSQIFDFAKWINEYFFKNQHFQELIQVPVVITRMLSWSWDQISEVRYWWLNYRSPVNIMLTWIYLLLSVHTVWCISLELRAWEKRKWCLYFVILYCENLQWKRIYIEVYHRYWLSLC